MKNTLRQIAVIVVILATITINILANALPINGMNTGQVSDSFSVYFVPAGYVFSIWGIIYIGLIAYAIYQALPGTEEQPAPAGHRLVGGAGRAGKQHVDLPVALPAVCCDSGRHVHPAGDVDRCIPGPARRAEEGIDG